VLACAGRRPAFSPIPLTDSLGFRGELGEVYMTTQCAQALLATQAAAAHQAASSGIPLSAAQRGTLRGTVAITMATARRVVEAAYLLGGGPALYERSPLQRRLRDIHAASQHAAAGRHSYALLGEELLGQRPELLRT
jgi:alkylation response protein AidB-like acyl-CoA dehydrogenase